ncbi:hypothetical protein ABH15_02195 [Methanoculleus taiwanensis]|uniref:Uncharacterized protein n=1 Tax=Methanoculleus taiwanensis TaxID=1550565 RepID=A0A498H2H0_9EURY|nr:hypothetical protein [Methanoculleus taiwanensis]RXE56973.1 hypothetical protein ABH15_02195 [Methanoculleus taiwanensis]
MDLIGTPGRPGNVTPDTGIFIIPIPCVVLVVFVIFVFSVITAIFSILLSQIVIISRREGIGQKGSCLQNHAGRKVQAKNADGTGERAYPRFFCRQGLTQGDRHPGYHKKCR